MTEVSAPNNIIVASPNSAFSDPKKLKSNVMFEDEDAEQQQAPQRSVMSRTNRQAQPPQQQQNTPTKRQPGPVHTEAPRLNYKSPQQTYDEALNFDAVLSDEERGGSGAAVSDTSAVKDSKFSHLIKSINNSEILYPTIVLSISAISLLVIVFQKSVSTIVKCVLIILYIAILVVTVVAFKNKV